MSPERPPLPPFDFESAARKARLAEDAWNSRDPERVSLAYTEDSNWRNRAEFFGGREAIAAFLRRKWARELDYRLIKEVWAFIRCAHSHAASCGVSQVLPDDNALLSANCARRRISSAAFTSA